MRAVGRRLRAAIREAAAAAPDAAGYRQQVLAAVHALVPFDAACLGGTDPAALVPTSLTTVGYGEPGIYAAVVDIEYGAGDEPTRLDRLRRLRVPIRTLREATDGNVRTSRFYADVLAPAGLRDEVRMLFRGGDGLCWGALTLARAGGREFTVDEVAALATVLGDVGDGLRTVLFRGGLRAGRSGQEGPATAVVGPGYELESATPAALDYLDRLGWEHPGGDAMISPTAAIAASLQHSAQQSVALRCRTCDGQWVVVRAGAFAGERPPRRVVVTIEPAQLPQIASLTALAHGLTRRESEVLAHVLAGGSRDEVARSLFLSPYTVQDHLKSIYSKTGTSSRRDLVAMLVRTEYLPRLGSPVAPDGWFADASRERA
jgi:DNA-binding CsgD family transcriptional regulator